MREAGWFIHFGAPLVWQQRNPQNLIRNLKAEIMGMEETPRFLQDLDNINVSGSTTLDRMRSAWDTLGKYDYIPQQARQTGLAWCEDIYDLLGV